MLIFKVMVCFLAVFRSEFYVGGLPTIQDSPDIHRAGRSGRSASNQGVTNEPGSRPVELLDHAECHEEEVRREVKPEIKIINNPVGSATAKIAAPIFGDDSAPRDSSYAEKFGLDVSRENVKIRRDGLGKGSSGVDQSKPYLDKSKSRRDQATTSYDIPTVPRDPTSSPGATKAQRFSSVYAKPELDEKVSRKKQEFKNDLSTYLADVLDTVLKTSTTTTTTGTPKSKNDNHETAKKPRTRDTMNSGNQARGNLLIGGTNVPVPEGESRVLTPLENRRRKSVGDVATWQQSTNMRPTRRQHLVQNKRSPAEGTLLKLPGNGGRKNARTVGGGDRDSYRRQFTVDGSYPSRGNRLQFSGVNPVQINAAMAYSNRQPPQQALNIDLSRALYQFGPAQLHALKGVFDKVPPSTQNFKPIAPEQVAYVPPRIVYETKILPTPFMPFRTEQKTVEALSALLGQNPTQQLEGFNLILRKDQPEKLKVDATPVPFTPEISRQGIHDPVALSQAFVTPVPSIDINSGLSDGSFRLSHDGRDPNEEIDGVVEAPFSHRTPQYSVPEDVGRPRPENTFKTIPIVEEPEETQQGQTIVQEELHPVWQGAGIPETTRGGNEGRYSQQNEDEQNHGEGYAAKYSFGYHVKDYDSGNNFGHQETRDGLVTDGRYHVLLPDGRVQNVKYHVDEGGYHAKVSYQLNRSV